jgi:hypothetical protein
MTREEKATKYMLKLKSLPDDVLNRAYKWTELNPLWADKKHNPRIIVNGGIYGFVKRMNRRFSLGFTPDEINRIVKTVYIEKFITKI